MFTKQNVNHVTTLKLQDLYSQNWSKVARAVGTKTTLQVKSYIKSHPELISSSSVHISNTPSPPQFINEVEVSNEDSVAHFSVGDIVYETEVPAVSMEEVIASVATSWELSSVKNGKKTNRSKPKTPSKDTKYDQKNTFKAVYYKFVIFLQTSKKFITSKEGARKT